MSTSTIKILITGANGFVGSHLIDEALSRGWDTYAAIRKSSNTEFLKDPRIKFCYPDYMDVNSMISILEKEKFDFIIHNAGLTRANSLDDYHKINVDYTANLAKAASAVSTLKKFVFISSIESYGSADDTKEGFVSENKKPNPRTDYGRSKQKAEVELKKETNLPWIILRPTAVFGPRERDFLELFRTVKKFKIAPIVGSPDIKYTFIYVKDLIRVTMDACLASGTHKGYFVSDGRIHKMSFFTGSIAKALGVNYKQVRIPLGIIAGVVKINGILDRFKKQKSLLNAEQYAKMTAENWDCDISGLVNDFNFFPQYNLEQAIEETATWYTENGWL